MAGYYLDPSGSAGNLAVRTEASPVENAHARYFRSNSGGGHWETYKKVPDKWEIRYQDLTFLVKPMGFKHVGLFPEQAVNWNFVRERIRAAGRDIRVLNLLPTQEQLRSRVCRPALLLSMWTHPRG